MEYREATVSRRSPLDQPHNRHTDLSGRELLRELLHVKTFILDCSQPLACSELIFPNKAFFVPSLEDANLRGGKQVRQSPPLMKAALSLEVRVQISSRVA